VSFPCLTQRSGCLAHVGFWPTPSFKESVEHKPLLLFQDLTPQSVLLRSLSRRDPAKIGCSSRPRLPSVAPPFLHTFQQSLLRPVTESSPSFSPSQQIKGKSLPSRPFNFEILCHGQNGAPIFSHTARGYKGKVFLFFPASPSSPPAVLTLVFLFRPWALAPTHLL